MYRTFEKQLYMHQEFVKHCSFVVLITRAGKAQEGRFKLAEEGTHTLLTLLSQAHAHWGYFY